MVYLIVLFIAILPQLALSYKVNFTDCGNGNIIDVRVKPCDGDPCVIKLGTVVQAEVDFKSPINTEALSEVIRGVIRGRELPFPEQRKDPCDGNISPSCPIKRGKKYQFKASFEVKPFYPAIPITVKYSLKDRTGRLVMCVAINAKIHDPNPTPTKSPRRVRQKGKKQSS